MTKDIPTSQGGNFVLSKLNSLMHRVINKLTTPTAAATPSPETQQFDSLVEEKKRLIDFACQNLGVRSIADMGGVWVVNGGYTFYGIEKYKLDSAYLVDTNFTEQVLKKKQKYPQLRLVDGNFGDAKVAEEIGSVGAVMFFDTLLHQVNPNWDQVLEMYAPRTECFIIYNPQFTNTESSVRLLDLGEEKYFKNVPHTKDDEPYKTVFAKMDEIHPQHQRPYRDIHNIWQWGIVDDDLIAKLKNLGFTMQYFKNCGTAYGLPNFDDHAFVFQRASADSSKLD